MIRKINDDESINTVLELSKSGCLFFRLHSSLFAIGWWHRHLKFRGASHHLGETNADTFDDGEQHGTADGVVSGSLEATSEGEGTADEETGDDGVVRVLLLADALDGAVKGREETTPDAKVAAKYWGAHLDGCESTDTALTVGGVTETLDAVPDSASDGLWKVKC